MLRNLLDELIRRRLWPIPAVALLIALAAPVLFLKSTPAVVPAVTTMAPAATATGSLPERAQRLLAASDAGVARRGATGSSHDPFEPPASARARAAAAARASKAKDGPSKDSSSDAAPTDPIPVVIQNPDGSSPASDSSSPSTPSTPSSPRTPSAPRSAGSGSGSTPASAPSVRTASVDVRFGKGVDSHLQPSIAPRETFFIHGKLAAVFVKYSPSLDKAVFAVAPGIVITGPVRCRLDHGVCRYLDVPAGSYTRLTMVTADGTLVRRRLDVARIDRTPASADTTTTAAKDDSENACLLRELKTRNLGDAPIDRDACER